MKLVITGHSYRYEMENICRLFFPQHDIGTAGDGITVVSTLTENGGLVLLRGEITVGGHTLAAEESIAPCAEFDKECERRLAVILYDLLVKILDRPLDWGAVTGVRPVKLLRRMGEQLGEDSAAKWMREELRVSDKKLALCRRTLQIENRLLEMSRPDSYSLYIGIPFCPTRCDYCSFVSHTVQRAGKLIPDYVNYLCRELELTAEIAHGLGLRLETVYMGGGTPTTLTAEQMAQVMGTVEKHFDLSGVREYCVEAGRPDTVNEEKLRVIQGHGVGRISINPQSLSDAVLEAIGRKHTAKQFYDAFELARRCGFENINADLIVGLPGDSEEGFARSLDGLMELSPEGITVHALAMKRASNLVSGGRESYEGGERAVRMVDYSAAALDAQGYRPYYLYRQSYAAGNMENVGWSKPGFEGLYNVFIMDETHSIFGCGAGAVTKLRQPDGEYLERVFNYKFPYEYISRFDDMLERKKLAGEACRRIMKSM